MYWSITTAITTAIAYTVIMIAIIVRLCYKVALIEPTILALLPKVALI